MGRAERLDAVLLLGRGGYGPWPQEELHRMVEAVPATRRYHYVEGTFVNQGAPSLPQALQACVGAGARRILEAPVFVPMDRSLRIWLPKIIRRWLRDRRGADVEVVLADALGDDPAVGQAVAEGVAAAEGRQDVRGNAPVDRGEPGWSVIPPHRYHALFCTGPLCAALGSFDLWQQLRDRLEEEGLTTGRDAVRVVRTGYLYPCNLGPVMVVYPEGAWYWAHTPRALDRIVDDHFVRGRVVQAYARRPHSRPQKRPGD